MSKCKNCNVEILDDSQICPLCHSVLEEGEEGHNTYPDAWIPTRRLKFVTNIIFFLVLLGSVAAGYLNYIWYQGKLTLSGILYVILIDWIVGFHGWSVNYVLPAGIMLLDAGIVLLMIINSRNWQSYLMFQLFGIVCSLIPLLLIALHIVTHPGLSELAFGISVFLFLGTLIIGDRRARLELKRRFHVR